MQTEEWRTQCQELQEVIHEASRKLSTSETRAVPTKFRHLTFSAVERQFNYALGKQLSQCIILFCMGVKLDFLFEGRTTNCGCLRSGALKRIFGSIKEGKREAGEEFAMYPFQTLLEQLKQESDMLDVQLTYSYI